jgi:[acyl-carrier-protein] S-malonyltransferase
MAKIAFVFPGQGSASVGMGVQIIEQSPEAARIMDFVATQLPELPRLCREGPKEELIQTVNAQPAIFGVGLACAAALEAAAVRPEVVAGHSLGEFCALVQAGALSFEEALRLVVRRAQLMQDAGERRPSRMIAVMKLTPEQIEAKIGQLSGHGILAVANFNSPAQVIVSGENTAIDAASAAFKAEGAMVAELAVSGAFHSPVMAPAQQDFAPELERADFRDARIPVVSNATAEASTDAARLRAALIPQITAPVRWQASVATMANLGVDTYIEVGPGKVLSGLIRRCPGAEQARVLNVEDAASLEKTLATLAG